jgi:hypothetical protein
MKSATRSSICVRLGFLFAIIANSALAADPTNTVPTQPSIIPKPLVQSALSPNTQSEVALFQAILTIGYLFYVVQVWWALKQAKITFVPKPRPPSDTENSPHQTNEVVKLSSIFSDTTVALESYGFVFFSFILATALPTFFHLQSMGKPVIVASLMYYVTTSILFALILLEFNYLFELRNKSRTYSNWILLVLIALGIDLGMWLYLMLIGDPGKNVVLQGTQTTVFLALTTFTSFVSSALIILFARKLP